MTEKDTKKKKTPATVSRKDRKVQAEAHSVGEWHVMDAMATPLGRLATEASTLLQGKHRVDYAPNKVADVHVVVINSDQLKVTGDKMAQKKYYKYSGYPGGMRSRTLTEQMGRDSRAVIQRAVSGMLPKNNLRDDLMNHLNVYTGDKHPHTQVIKDKK